MNSLKPLSFNSSFFSSPNSFNMAVTCLFVTSSPSEKRHALISGRLKAPLQKTKNVPQNETVCELCTAIKIKYNTFNIWIVQKQRTNSLLNKEIEFYRLRFCNAGSVEGWFVDYMKFITFKVSQKKRCQFRRSVCQLRSVHIPSRKFCTLSVVCHVLAFILSHSLNWAEIVRYCIYQQAKPERFKFFTHLHSGWYRTHDRCRNLSKR